MSGVAPPKRVSWIDSITSAVLTEGGLDPSAMHELQRIDEQLFAAWNLGENLLLAWTRAGEEVAFMAVRHYELLEPRAVDHGDPVAAAAARARIDAALVGGKCLPPGEFAALRTLFGAATRILRVPLGPYLARHPELVDGLLTRYGVSLVRERAVMLLDAVDFSLHSPLEQVAMLNSLAYSVNSACRQLMARDIQFNFARTTTGDGFYIWNRAQTTDANIALYKLLLLILADNAVAQSKALRFPVPRLRAAFHVGSHYEFHQVEALNPTTFSYIVGPVTIELSRFVEQALAGQILLGDFRIALHGDAAATPSATISDTIDFIRHTADRLHELDGLTVANDRVAQIRCYLTGPQHADGSYGVQRYRIADKHGRAHCVYNAKINIHLAGSRPIFLGYQHRDLHGEGARVWAEMA